MHFSPLVSSAPDTGIAGGVRPRMHLADHCDIADLRFTPLHEILRFER